MGSETNTIIQNIEALDQPKISSWIAEARFGYRYVKEGIKYLPTNSNILEVGCGSGILLSMLIEEFPSHQFNGVEPFGEGFSSSKEVNSLIQRSGFKIDICGYEEHVPTEKYDLIYCVNVFEHVNDWRHFLDWASNNLSENGLFIVLCPNYAFPYESHFRIPIVWNKKLTFKLFSNYINKFEEKNESVGLWASLNFVTKRNVKHYIRIKENLHLTFFDDVSIIDDLVSRILTDTEFRKRQKFLGNITLFIKKIGMLNLVKLFSNFLPYMKIIFQKSPNNVH